jgi:hypothetical protein
MANRPSCRSCRHCSSLRGAETGWCQLRKLSIDPDLAGQLWCHHWTACPPRLPLAGDSSSVLHNQSSEQQLHLIDVLER